MRQGTLRSSWQLGGRLVGEETSKALGFWAAVGAAVSGMVRPRRVALCSVGCRAPRRAHQGIKDAVVQPTSKDTVGILESGDNGAQTTKVHCWCIWRWMCNQECYHDHVHHGIDDWSASAAYFVYSQPGATINNSQVKMLKFESGNRSAELLPTKAKVSC